jgi:hypothetical protein
METNDTQTGLKPAELRTISVGFWLVGIAIAVTAVSYFLNMEFSIQWLVWAIAVVFLIYALLTFEWTRALQQIKKSPGGKFRLFLLLSIPLAFVISSQVCGLGLRACNVVCHITNLALIGLGAVTAIRIHRNQSVFPILIPMIVISLIPHCVCHAPINLVWHNVLGGVAPTCEMIPMAATLFAVTALKGVRPRRSTLLVLASFGVMLFIIIGGIFIKFPWQGCVDHQMITS